MATCRTCPRLLLSTNRSGFCVRCSARLLCRVCSRPTRFKRGGYCYACDDVRRNIIAAHKSDDLTPHPGLSGRLKTYQRRAAKGLPLFAAKE